MSCVKIYDGFQKLQNGSESVNDSMRHKTTTLNTKATTRLISTQLEAVSERSGGGRPPHEVQ